ncbi:MAG TPA: hypothetical protein VFR34_09750 [Paracoccaceae bacterium]|nr:hypothetical protein [Paracoccaceae bacterium]
MPKIYWGWVLWQVTVPVLGPFVLAAGILALWATGAPAFQPNYGTLIAYVSPWALTVYSLTLLGSTFHALVPKLGTHPALGVAMLVLLMVVGVYAAFIAVWQHDPGFRPSGEVYTVAGVLLFVTIVLGHQGHHIRQKG